MSSKVEKFADTLSETAELLRLSVIKRRGQKAVGLRARVALGGIKKAIPEIRKKIMENENE
jgi:hypothetical protein